MDKPRRRRAGRPQRLPKVLRRHEWDAVIHAAGTDRSQALLELRDEAIIALLLGSGIRRGELAALRISDLDLEAGKLHVRHGKGDKERFVAVGGPALDLTEAYLDVRMDDESDDGPLFLSRKGGGLSGSQIGRIVKAAGRKSGHGETLHAHTLRHSHATRLVEKGNNLFMVADQLGHADLDTTRIYTHIAFEERQEMVKDL